MNIKFLRFMDNIYHKTWGLLPPLKYFCDKYEAYWAEDAKDSFIRMKALANSILQEDKTLLEKLED